MYHSRAAIRWQPSHPLSELTQARHPVPTLRLSGRWLEQLCFAIGKKLQVSVRDGELVLGQVTKV